MVVKICRSRAAISQKHLDFAVERESDFFQATVPAFWLPETPYFKAKRPLGTASRVFPETVPYPGLLVG